MNRVSVRLVLVLAAGAAAAVAGVLLLMVVLGFESHPAGATTTPAPSSGEFTAIPAVRLFDTAHGVGGPRAKLGPGKTITVQITGRGGIPAGATAITTNVIASTGTASGRLTVYPAGAARPPATTVYFGAHQTVANNATVALSTSGKLTVFNDAGTVNVDLDVEGYYAPNAKIADLQTQITTLSGKLDTVSAQVGTLQTQQAADEDKIATLQTKQTTDEASVTALTTLLSGVSRVTLDSQPTLRFSGMNLQLVNGAGTESAVNGRGNLIVGYDDNSEGRPRTGSHNIITGDDNSWTSYGGLVGGDSNRLDGPESAIIGGSEDQSNGRWSAISGGEDNTASGDEASVSGGEGNTANALGASVSGGYDNNASGQFASVSGGYGNSASNESSSVSGGLYNAAIGQISSVTGGARGTASNTESVVSGGYGNTASGVYSWVGGGYFGTASVGYSTITGGYGNIASGLYSTVAGGYINEANGYIAAILGGELNKSPAKCSSVPASPITGTCS